jgi:ATP-dependent protease ClpP protease subunit
MSEPNHKLDHTLKVKTEDLVDQVHEKDVDLISNHIYLFGREEYHSETGEEPGVEYLMANRFIRNLNLCMRVNPDTPIVIHMKTCGGIWEEGMAIYDAIKSCPFPVTILSYTHARSMSSLIFQAANKRVMMPHSIFMFHDGTLGLEGTVKQVTSAVEFGKVADAQMMEIYINAMKEQGKFCKRSRKFIAQWIREQMDKKEDVYLTAHQAVEYGFADEIFDYNWKKLTDYTEEQILRG